MTRSSDTAVSASAPAVEAPVGECDATGAETEHQETLQIDELTFEVRRSDRRKTLELIVDRGGELIVVAPPDAPADELASFVQDKRFWLYTKLAEKKERRQPVPARSMSTGESFPYLGRTYRLLLVSEQDGAEPDVPLKLEAGRFKLLRTEAPRGREHFIRWYTAHARPWLRRRLKRFDARIGVKATRIHVQDLGYRWGSCGADGGLNFHWAAILLPPSIIDYLLVHELAHLREPHHTPAFWHLVERTLPDAPERREWLAREGGGYLRL